MIFTQTVWWIMLGAAIIVGVSAVYLAYLNWNENLSATTVSVLLGAAVAFFIAVLAGLKSSSTHERFVSAVVLDAKGLPVWFEAGSPGPPEEMRGHLSDLRSIAQDNPFPSSDPNGAARQLYAARLLQYSLLKRLIAIGPEAGTSIQVARTVVVSLRPPIDCELREVAPEEIGNLAGNPFANVAREREILRRVPIKIPKKAKVALHDGPIPSIVFNRSGYFSFSITVRPLGDSKGVLPKGFEYLKERALECHSIPFIVEFDARFEKYTGGSKYASQVQTWVRAICEQLRREASTQAQ
jgi:hypothetical protein